MGLPKRLIAGLFFTLSCCASASAPLTLNDKAYFERQGLNVLVFSNWYNGLFSDSKISGVEIIHHGVRTATNGDVRLHATPEQWDAIPTFVDKKVTADSVEAFLRYPDFDFDYSIKVTSDGDGLLLSVNLPEDLPEVLIGKAGFNLEFIPSAYFEKSYLMDDQAGVFPLYPSGPKEQNDKVRPKPLAQGQSLLLAPADPSRKVSIESLKTPVSLYDGRAKAQNGWFVVRSEIPAGQKGDVIQWRINASTEKNWLREPVIAHSQVGYHPQQQKVAVLEQDSRDKTQGQISLLKIDAEGSHEVLKSNPRFWGQYTRYHYSTFDFTQVTEPGIYQLQYGSVTTAPFRIGKDVYADVWHPTLDVYFPVQMDHVLVNEAYRVWHGASHLDDALQAPVDHQHFDLYAQGPTTDTPYAPGEHIPGLNIGGWYDAGDYDIRTQTQYRTVRELVAVWEQFRPERDTTLVDYPAKYVDIHVPDGKPDLLQQIEHGTLALLAQYRALGRAIPGIIVPDISQYTHLGDGLTMTDNLIYDANMSELESDGIRSGKFDDRWAFTSRSSALNYGSMAALAAASRALKGYNEALAAESLQTALAAWEEEQSHEPYTFRHGNTTGGRLPAEQLTAAVELLITTGEAKYQQAVTSLLPELQQHFGQHAALAVRAIPYMDKGFRNEVQAMADEYRKQRQALAKKNPFAVNITEGGWAGNGTIIRDAVNGYYLHREFPQLFSAEMVYQGLNYLYGTHPDSDISFVSNVGTQSKKVAYGMNRADFSFISGAIVPGVLILKPDLPENREDWPFFWGQNEYVINMGAGYLFLSMAAESLLNP